MLLTKIFRLVRNKITVICYLTGTFPVRENICSSVTFLVQIFSRITKTYAVRSSRPCFGQLQNCRTSQPNHTACKHFQIVTFHCQTWLVVIDIWYFPWYYIDTISHWEIINKWLPKSKIATTF